MKKLVRIVLLAGVGTALAVLALLWWDGHRQPQWPHFPDAKDASAPQMLVEYDEPYDFGFRTGNLIPLQLIVKAPPGVSIEEETLSLQGDMQLVEKETERATASDGTRYYRFRLHLQSLVYKPKWEGTAALAYRLSGDNKLGRLQSEAIEIYPSKTFDGRKVGHPKDPVLAPRQGYHALVTLAMIVGGIGGMVVSLWQPWRKRQAKPTQEPAVVMPDKFLVASQAYDAVCAATLPTRDQLRELVRALRNAYGVPEHSYGYLMDHAEDRAWYDPLGRVLQVCEDAAVWADRGLTESEQELLRSLRSSLIGLVDPKKPAATAAGEPPLPDTLEVVAEATAAAPTAKPTEPESAATPK